MGCPRPGQCGKNLRPLREAGGKVGGFFAAAILILFCLGLNPAAAQIAPDAPAPVDDNPFPRRLAVPDLTGGVDWINTGRPARVEGSAQGSSCCWDFWTYCCINCMRVLQAQESSRKCWRRSWSSSASTRRSWRRGSFEKHCRATCCCEIKHPVVNDAKHAIWDQFSASAVGPRPS